MRSLASGAAVVGALLLAGCTAGSGVIDTVSVSGMPTSGSTPGPATSGSASSSPGSTAPGTPVPTTTGPSISGTPSVSTGNPGAYTVVGTDGSGATVQVPSLQCGQDGSVVAPQIQVSAGGRSVTIVGYGGGDDLTVSGSADLDAAGGVFRGSDGTVTVAFTWTC